MPWSFGIVVLKNTLLYLLGDQDGVFAYESKKLSLQLSEQLNEVFSLWGVGGSMIEDVYLAVTPCLERLLPPDWNHLHLRQTPSPVERNPILPEFLCRHLRCFNSVGEEQTLQDVVIRECVKADGVSIAASYSPLFPEREDQVKKKIHELNPGVRVFCSYHYPVLNLFLREKCLIFQALCAGILERWYSDLLGFFKNSKLRLWLVEDEAIFWDHAEGMPQRVGLESDRTLYFLLARGTAICDGAEHALAVYHNSNGYYLLEVNGKNVRLLEEEEHFNSKRPLGQIKSLLRNISPGQNLALFNYTGSELRLGYPFKEKKAAFSVAAVGLGLFNSPKRIRLYTLSLQQNQQKVKEEMAVKLLKMNRQGRLFDQPKIGFKVLPLRYLPYSGFFMEGILSATEELPDVFIPEGQAGSTALPRYPR